MDFRTVILDPDSRAPAAEVANEHIVAEMTDLDAMRRLAALSDVVTLEWENADVAAVRSLAEMVPVHPSADVLAVAQNRILEKRTARRIGLETAEFAAVDSIEDLREALERFGAPALLKTVTGGYDAKGQRKITRETEAEAAFAELGGGTAPLILEGWVDYKLEISVITARGKDGRMVSFPVSENIHREGILDFTIVPARIDESVTVKAIRAAQRLTEELDVIGLLTVEMFVTADDHVLVNEIAPRPHNSGHYSWEACTYSQFEQQLRAACGLPLCPPTLLRPAAMANLLGHEIGSGRLLDSVATALATPDVALHLYGKAEPRTGRKMGHLTALGPTADDAYRIVVEARRALIGGGSTLSPMAGAADTRG